MTDRRTYVRMHEEAANHPKIVAAGSAAGWMWFCAICYCARLKTDGQIPTGMVVRLTDFDDPKQLASRLLEAKLWHPALHDCDRCPQGVGDVYVIHDYLEHQRSAAEIADLSIKRAIAGRNGGRASGESRRGTNDEANREANDEANASANAKQVAKQPRTKTEPDTDTTSRNQKPSWSEPATPADEQTSTRPDVEKLCSHLVDLMVADGCKTPTITKRWRDEARRLLDLDKRPLNDALALLEWCQADPFWKANIQSITKFREKYDTLRLRRDAHAQQPNGTFRSSYQPFQNQPDSAYQEAL